MDTIVTYDKDTKKLKFSTSVTTVKEEQITVEELKKRIADYTAQINERTADLILQRDNCQVMLDLALANIPDLNVAVEEIKP